MVIWLAADRHTKLRSRSDRPVDPLAARKSGGLNGYDFVVTGGPFGPLLAEAVVASHQAQGVPEWAVDLTKPPPPREDLLDLAALRLAQALVGKHEKWKTSYSALPHCAGGPFVICVAPFEQPWASMQGTEAIDRVLFGGPRPVFVLDGEGEPHVLGYSSISAAFKPSGAPVAMGMFTTPAFAEVSAVLFSSLATWSKVSALAEPGEDDALLQFQVVRWFHGRGLAQTVEKKASYRETLVDGAHLFLNPYAAHPLDPIPWRTRGFGAHRHQAGGTLSDIPDGALFFRRAVRVRPRREDDSPVEPHVAPADMAKHVKQPPPDGVFFGGPAKVLLTDSIELCLRKGFTIYVGRDTVDHDWNSMAKPGIHLSVQDFMDAEAEPWMGAFVESREAALAQAQAHVDLVRGTPEDDQPRPDRP